MREWIRRNLIEWTVLVAVLVFIFGPFIQSVITTSLSDSFTGQEVEISVCSPLRQASLIVSSTDGETTKIHSANQYPLMQQMRVVIKNNTGSPIAESSVFIAPLNAQSNELLAVNFYTDNNISRDLYTVDELPDNAFQVDLGNFLENQSLVLEFISLYPTTFIVEYGGLTASAKSITNSGSCDSRNIPEATTLPVDFYSNSFTDSIQERAGSDFVVDDVVDPIGPVKFEVVLDYDCGSGAERQTVRMGGPVEYCYMRINKDE